jgi:virginiamycin B lyase
VNEVGGTEGNGSIGRITTAGAVTSYAIPPDGACPCRPHEIIAGPDGALWFTYYGTSEGSIGRITTAGVVTSNIETYDDAQPQAITSGPDGALWFTTLGNTLQRITTAGVITNIYSYYAALSTSGISYPSLLGAVGIVSGPDGALWITEPVYNSLVRFTTAVTPEIGDFTPKSGGVGATVTIAGHNLAGATVVAFNGVAAAIVSDTSRTVVVTVPGGATTGQISVMSATGTATSSGTFKVT